MRNSNNVNNYGKVLSLLAGEPEISLIWTASQRTKSAMLLGTGGLFTWKSSHENLCPANKELFKLNIKVLQAFGVGVLPEENLTSFLRRCNRGGTTLWGLNIAKATCSNLKSFSALFIHAPLFNFLYGISVKIDFAWRHIKY